jgi:hypothetical protein
MAKKQSTKTKSTKTKSTKAKSAKAAKPAAALQTSTDLASQVRNSHQKIVRAVHAVLAKQGIKGLTMHSIRFDVAADVATPSGCVPPCLPSETCRMHSGDDGTYPVCVPNN